MDKYFHPTCWVCSYHILVKRCRREKYWSCNLLHVRLCNMHRDCCLIFIWNKVEFRLKHIEAEAKWPPFARRHFQMDFLEWKYMYFDKISLKCDPRGPINYILELVQIMVWNRPDDMPLSEPMVVRLPTHVCITRPQWVKNDNANIFVRQYTSLTDGGTATRLVANQREVMTRLLELLYVLNTKRNIF